MRPLTPADHDAARAIYNHYVLTSTATFAEEPLTAAEFAEQVAPATDRHGAWAVLDDGGAVAGYALLAVYSPRSGYRDTASVAIYLAPDVVGTGLGSAALRHVEAHARFHTLLAGACAENDASLRLFERHGYERVAHLREVGRKFGRLLDVVWLQKVLDPPA